MPEGNEKEYHKIKVLGIRIGQIMLMLVVLVVLGIAGFLWYLLHPEKMDPDCFARDVVLVKIGETYLAVPRDYKPIFHAPEGKSIPYADRLTMLWVCQREDDPPLEVRDIWIGAENLFQFVALNNNPVAISDKVLTDDHKGFELDGVYVRYQPQKRANYEEKVIQELLAWQQKAHQIINSDKLEN